MISKLGFVCQNMKIMMPVIYASRQIRIEATPETPERDLKNRSVMLPASQHHDAKQMAKIKKLDSHGNHSIFESALELGRAAQREL